MPKYVVTNGISFLRRSRKGDYCLCDENCATVWSTYKQAQNALNNGVCKRTRDSFYVEKDGKIEDPETEIKRLIEADTSDFNRWISGIGNFKKLVNTLEIQKENLILQLSDIDKEICDIRHYIEFGKLNAYQGWAAYEMMRTSLLQRRKIKDVLYIISEMQTSGDKVSKADSARIAIYNLNRRTYKPRKLEFLFEECNGFHY